MPPQRLPIVDGDDGVWGDILRQYLMKEHVNDDTDNAANGGHKTITIAAGTAAAGTAPLKFTSGTLLTSPEVGAVEFAGDNLYVTQTSGTTRKKVALYDDSSGATGDIYYRNGSGYFTRLGVGGNGTVLTVSSGTPSWQTPTVDGSNITNLDDAVAALMTGDYEGTPTAIDQGVNDLFTTIWTAAVPWIIVDNEDFSDENTFSTASRRAIKAYVENEIADLDFGDASTNTSSSVANEVALFADTNGKLLKRATGTGIATLTSGVLSATTAPAIADFTNATHTHQNAAGGGQLNITTASNATGTPSSSTFLRGDNTWSTPTGGLTWNEVTGTSQSATVDNGYIANNAGLVTVTLPATAAVGKSVRVAGKGAGGWRLAQNASQVIHFGNMDTTTGTGGRLDSTNRYDSVELVCITTNTDWVVTSSVGNINVT